MNISQAFHQRQSDAPSAVVHIMSSLGLIVAFEDILLFFLGNAYTCIAHRELQIGEPVTVYDSSFHGNHSTFRRKFQGIGEQIVQHQIQIVGREPHLFTIILCIGHELQALGTSWLGKRLRYSSYQFQRIAPLDIKWKLICFQFVERDQLVDERLQFLRILNRHIKMLLALASQCLLLSGQTSQWSHNE